MDTELIAYLDERFGKIDDTLRQTVEGVRGEIHLLAEGMIDLEERLRSLRGDVTFQLERIHESIAPYYKDLDCRVRLLEDRAARENQAPIDIIRERYGKTS